MNRLKTLVLLATLTALLMWAGQILGGSAGLSFALGIAIVINIGTYWFADRIVLRMYNAHEVSPAQAPDLYSMVRELSSRADLPMSRLFIIPEDAPNAFATGRNPANGIVAVTEGLLRTLNRREVAGVVAHELGHIKNRDTLIMAIAATLAGALSMLANAAMWSSLFGSNSDEQEGNHPLAGLLGVLVAPFAATLVQLSISRVREFVADAAAARYTQDPLALASALGKIEAYASVAPMEAASPGTAHLFIRNPLASGGIARLFSTHPPTEERIARLKAMAAARTYVAA